MLGDISIADNIYIITGYTDMRKNIDGLCAVIMEQMKEDPDRHATICSAESAVTVSKSCCVSRTDMSSSINVWTWYREDSAGRGTVPR